MIWNATNGFAVPFPDSMTWFSDNVHIAVFGRKQAPMDYSIWVIDIVDGAISEFVLDEIPSTITAPK